MMGLNPSVADGDVTNQQQEDNMLNNFWEGISRFVEAHHGQQQKSLLRKPNTSIHHTVQHQRLPNQHFVFHPNHPLHILWDFLLLCLLLFSVFIIPYNVGFNIEITSHQLMIDTLISTMFGIDILVQCNSCYYDLRKDIWIRDHKQVVKQYLSYWFWIDIITTIPWDRLVFLMNGKKYQELSLIRLIRIAKLYNYYIGSSTKSTNTRSLHGKVNNNTIGDATFGHHQYQEDHHHDDDHYHEHKLYHSKPISIIQRLINLFHLNPTFISFFGLMIQIFFIAHVFACFWHYIAIDSYVTTGSSSKPESTWLKKFDYSHASLRAQYVASLYFVIVTLSTVGYGDIYPTNDFERIYAMIMMIVGAVFFATLVAQVAQAMDRHNPQQQAFNKKLYDLKVLLAKLNVPVILRNYAKRSYSFYLRKRSAYDERDIYSKLTPHILQELVYERYKKDIQKVTFFTSSILFDNHHNDRNKSNVVVHLITHSYPCQFFSNEIIYNEGDVCKEIGFLKKGSIRLDIIDYHSSSSSRWNQKVHNKLKLKNNHSNNKILVGYLTQGDMLGDSEYYQNGTALCTSQAVTYTQLLLVSHTEVKNAIEQAEHVSIRYRIDAMLKQRNSNLMAVIRATSDEHVKSLEEWLDDRDDEKDESEMAQDNREALQEAIHDYDQFGHHEVNHIHHLRLLKDMKVHKYIFHNGYLDNLLNSSYNIELLIPKPSKIKTFRVYADLPIEGEVSVSKENVLQPLPERKVIIWFEKQFQDRWLLLPEGKYKLVWDYFIACLIIYSVIVLPVELAFHETLYPSSNNMNLMISLMFSLDIMFCFRTCVDNKERDALVVSTKEIAIIYVKGWFWVDLISTIPWDSFILLVYGDNNNNAFAFQNMKMTQLVKILRLLRLLRMFHAIHIKPYLETLESVLKISPLVFEMLLLLIQVFFIVHLSSCIWWGCTTGMGNEPWYGDAIQEDSMLARKYLLSIYFTFTTMSTVGYGDLHPQGVVGEQLLGCVLVILGASMFGYMIAKVSNVLNSSSSSSSHGSYSEELNVVAEYLGERLCSERVNNMIMRHCERQYDEQSSTSLVELLEICKCLPPCLKVDILFTVYEKKISKIPIFSHIENRSVILYIFHLLKPTFYEMEDVIIREGEAAKELLFVVSGSARAFQIDPVFELKHIFDDDVQPLSKENKYHHAKELQNQRIRYLLHVIDPELILWNDSQQGSDKITKSTQSLKSIKRKRRNASMRNVPSSILSTQSNPLLASTTINDATIDAHASYLVAASDIPISSTDTTPHVCPFADLHEDDFAEAGYRLLGDLHPGDFIGHVAFMSCLPHEASVRSLTATTIYSLSKEEISNLIRTEPRVGIQLQSAIARAVIAQSTEVGRYHMRRNRAKFLKSLKYKYLRHHVASVFEDDSTKSRRHQSTKFNFVSTSSMKHRAVASQLKYPIGLKRLPSRLQKKRSSMLLHLQAQRRPKVVESLFADKGVWYDSNEEDNDVDVVKPVAPHSSNQDKGSNKPSTRDNRKPNIKSVPTTVWDHVAFSNPNKTDDSRGSESCGQISLKEASKSLLKSLPLSNDENNTSTMKLPKMNKKESFSLRRAYSMSSIETSSSQQHNYHSYLTLSTIASRSKDIIHNMEAPNPKLLRAMLQPKDLSQRSKITGTSFPSQNQVSPLYFHPRLRSQSFPSTDNVLWKEHHIYQGIV